MISTNNFINIYQNFKIDKDAILKNYKIDYKDNLNIKYFFNNIDLATNILGGDVCFFNRIKIY